MKRIVIVVILLLSTIISYGQTFGLEGTFQVGFNLPIHPRYPTIQAPSYTAEIGVLHHPKRTCAWAVLHKYPTVAYFFRTRLWGMRS